jgi:lipoate-protein ligase B
MLIDTIIVPAVYAAQQSQAEKPIDIVTQTGSHLTLDTDRIVIAPEYKVSAVVREGGVTFHGPIDYTILIVNKKTFGTFATLFSFRIANSLVYRGYSARGVSAATNNRPQLTYYC